jgi:hypothetical protein
MAYRLVPKDNAATVEAAEFYVTADSGGTVIPTGVTTEVSGGWSVQVYSTDGSASRPTAAGRTMLKVLLVSEDGKFARVRGAGGFEFDVPCAQPIFLPSFPGETVTLRPGTTISCEIVSGTHDQLSAVLVEDDALRERPEFNGTQEEVVSWTPGIATGAGFSKQ